MSSRILNPAPIVLLASALAFAGCSGVSTTTTSSRAGLREIHQTVRAAPASELALIQALAAESAEAAAQVETHSSAQGDISP